MPPHFEADENATAFFMGKKMSAPYLALADKKKPENVLGASSFQKKVIQVSLKTQMLTALEGNTVVLNTPISSGLWGKTPTGTYTIWSKFESTRMTGGEGDDYYDLPNVPYVLFFENDEVPGYLGYSIHGTYWHNNFGHPMSHGCINMRTTDGEKIYNWAEIGTQVIIKE
jgi:lipoprotein-anchoring transpeptidase ErfK/SrfK